MSVKDDLIAARALIDAPEKWTRGMLGNGTCFCAMGAVGKVLRDRRGDRSFFISDTPQYKALAAVLPEGRSAVPAFNDDPHTTHADIMDLFDRAISAQGDQS